jgi:hypothetical protein
MPSSFFSRSAFSGPTPFKYSIGLSNMEGVGIMFFVLTKIEGFIVGMRELENNSSRI